MTWLARLSAVLLLGGTLVVATASTSQSQDAPGSPDVPQTIPVLKEWVGTGGVFQVTARSRIAAADVELAEEVDVLLDDIEMMTGQRLSTVHAPRAANIVLRLGDTGLPTDGYVLEITPTKVTITAATDRGVFLGTRSLLQLLAQSATFPTGTARDWPRYPERGLMLDLGRQHLPPEWIEQHIREIAYLKMNVLHLHLSDNVGFRVESETHPEIVSEQHLTKDAVRHLLAVAERYHVDVLAEIDMPGHMQQILKDHPEFQLVDALGQRNPTALDITNPRALDFAREIIEEYLELFPGEFWHGGGDEFLHPLNNPALPAEAAYPQYPSLLAHAQAEYGPTAVHKDAFLGFINWMDDLVRSHGRTLRVWADGLHSGSAVTVHPEIVAEWWQFTQLTARASDLAAAGHQILNAGWNPTYYTVASFREQTMQHKNPLYWDKWEVHEFWGFEDAITDGLTEPRDRVDPDSPSNLGSRVHVWFDEPGLESIDDTAVGICPKLRLIAQKTWRSPTDASWGEFMGLSAAIGRAPGFGIDGPGACASPHTSNLSPEEPGADEPAADTGPPGGKTTVTHHVVESFDGTPIEMTMMLPPEADDGPVPMVLRGHGFADHRMRSPDGVSSAVPLFAAGWDGMVPPILDAGYGVITWDARGFGCSGGEVELDDPQVEGRDVSSIIDWLLTNAPVATDGADDPRIGMVGESYGGGIQTATASIDPRVDAIVPTASWADLEYALFPGEVTKPFFMASIFGVGVGTAAVGELADDCQTGPHLQGVNPEIAADGATLVATETMSDDMRALLAARSVTGYGKENPVAVPTMVIQGTTDNLFPIRQGVLIADHVARSGAPAKLVLTCGGHGFCPPSYDGDTDFPHLFGLIVDWLDRYVRDDRSVDVGSPIEVHSNAGGWMGLDDMPAAEDGLVASGAGGLITVPLVSELDPIPFLTTLVEDQIFDASSAAFVASQPSATDDPRSLTIPVTTAGEHPIELLGLPTVQLTVSGTGGPTTNLFVKFLDREENKIVNVQEGAIRVPVTSDPSQAASARATTTTVDVTMPGVAYTLAPGHHLDLQIATHSSIHAMGRTPATLDVSVEVAVPVLDDAPIASAHRKPQEISLVEADSDLPRTGGPSPIALALAVLALALALALRRLRPS